MISARPGYWDVDRCSWVGADPVYVLPALLHVEHHEETPGEPEVPAPRAAPVIDLEPDGATPA